MTHATMPRITAATVIDEDHLDRQTFGDRDLVREVLTMFLDQCTIEGARLSHLAPSERSALAHRLKGAARGIGAFPLALTLESIERADSFGAAARALATFATTCRETEAAARKLLAP